MSDRRNELTGIETEPSQPEVADPCPSLLVVGRTFVSAYPLPLEGEVVIGRDKSADLQLHESSVSRRHARIRVSGGGEVTIADLGSSNGTRVDGRELAPDQEVPVATNEPVELGGVVVFVRPRPSAVAAPRELCTRDAFLERMLAGCERSAPFALIHVATTGSPDELATQILSQVRPTDVVASLGPADIGVLLVATAPNEAATIADRVRRTAPDRIRIGIARFPDDGVTPAHLLETARLRIARGDPDTGVAVVLAPRMQELYELIGQIAPSDISVLLLGETGVGKEVFAERIHAWSERSDHPLLRLNCAALSEMLLEAELFGYERGAFTGAVQAKPGLLEVADGGTVFLDEIGDLPLSLQAKLLRVLEDSQVRRVGGLQSRTVDVRIISATHKAIEEESNAGRFRRDLYYRINGISVEIPPLRERREEIAALADLFGRRAAARAKRPRPQFSPEAIEALEAYDWPGNLRELRNAIDRAVLLCGDRPVQVEHLPETVRGKQPAAPPASFDLVDGDSELMTRPTLRVSRDDHERAVIEAALRECNGNQTRAARKLGIARSTLVKRIEKYGLPRPRKRDDD